MTRCLHGPCMPTTPQSLHLPTRWQMSAHPQSLRMFLQRLCSHLLLTLIICLALGCFRAPPPSPPPRPPIFLLHAAHAALAARAPHLPGTHTVPATVPACPRLLLRQDALVICAGASLRA